MADGIVRWTLGGAVAVATHYGRFGATSAARRAAAGRGQAFRKTWWGVTRADTHEKPTRLPTLTRRLFAPLSAAILLVSLSTGLAAQYAARAGPQGAPRASEREARIVAVECAAAALTGSTLLALLLLSLVRSCVSTPVRELSDALNRSRRTATSAAHFPEAATRELQQLTSALRKSLAGQARTVDELQRLAVVASHVRRAAILTDALGQIEWVNDAFVQLTGYTRMEAAGRRPGVLLQGPQTDPQTVETMRAKLRERSGFRAALWNYTKNGRAFWAEIDVQPVLNEYGDVMQFVAIGEDATERQAATEALRKTQESLEGTIAERTAALEQRNRELQSALDQLRQAQSQLMHSDKMACIGQLAAGVAHEINNPIGFIASNLTSLNEYVRDLRRLFDAFSGAESSAPRDEKTLSEWFEHVQSLRREIDLDFIAGDLGNLLNESMEGARRVKKIVADLRDFSHVDNPELAPEDLNQLIERTLSVATNELKYKADVVREFGEIPPVPCAGGKIGQVVLNLLVNAAQAIELRGRITVRTGADDRTVWLEVEDTGCGISAEHRKHLFEPFFTTKEVGKGTGLGLHVAYCIVEAHGGRIDVRSEAGAGACFRVTLPLAPKPTEPESARAARD